MLPILPSPPPPKGEGNASSCACPTCRQACEHKPGWLMPGEAEVAAEALGLSPRDFFRRFLAVDWWDGDPRDGHYDLENVFVLAPAVGGCAGGMYPANPKGRCVFYTDARLCAIHPVKPFECRTYAHGPKDDTHRQVAIAWIPHQEQIRDLLGREPVAEDYSPLDAIFGW